jgi:hypothetical protein
MPKCKPKDLQSILVSILDERVDAEGLGKRKTMSKREAILRQIVEKAGEGDRVSLNNILDFLGRNRRPRYQGASEPLITKEEVEQTYGRALGGSDVRR